MSFFPVWLLSTGDLLSSEEETEGVDLRENESGEGDLGRVEAWEIVFGIYCMRGKYFQLKMVKIRKKKKGKSL